GRYRRVFWARLAVRNWGGSRATRLPARISAPPTPNRTLSAQHRRGGTRSSTMTTSLCSMTYPSRPQPVASRKCKCTTANSLSPFYIAAHPLMRYVVMTSNHYHCHGIHLNPRSAPVLQNLHGDG